MKKALMMAGWIGLAAASGFSASQYPPALLGGWKTTVTVKGNPVETTIFLRAGGACVCRLAAGGKTVDAEGTWTVSGKRLRVDVSGQTILDATFEVKGDTLILDGGANRCVRVADTTAAEKPMAAPEAGKTGGDLRLPEVKLRPNVICGYVVDAQGRPISEGVGKIRVHAWTRGLHGEVHNNAVPDEKGYYEIKVEEAGWYIEGWLRLKTGQDMLVLELRPLQTRTTQWPSGEGVRMDFVWSISGVKPDMAGNPRKAWEFYGMHVTIQREDISSVKPAVGDTYVFTLVPQGPLIDGTAGRTLTREWKHEERWEDPRLADIPVGTYVLSGRLVSPNGTAKALKFRETGAQWWDRIEIRPEAQPDDGKLKPIILRMAEGDR